MQIKADITRLSETAPLKSSIQWSTSDPDIATVDSNGNITAVSSGETSIFVRTLDTNISDKCDITVI